MSCDLHIHSTCSDGAVPIERLAPIAARTGLHAIALSDHDTLLSAQYAYAHTGQDGVELIPAVELTGYDFERQHRVHLLCYYPDVDCPALGIVLHSPEYLPVRQVLATAKACGGAVVFAHPTVYKSMPLLRELAAEGAVDGIEVYHPSNSPEDSTECLALCKQHGLVATAGTDFHGRNHKHPHPIGTCTAPDEAAAQLRAIAEKRKRERT